MNKEEVREELRSYTNYMFQIENYKLELVEEEIKFKEVTEPTLGGYSSEPNSDIRAKNKISEAIYNQAISNIEKEKYYKARIDKIKNIIREYEIRANRIEKLINLASSQEKKDILTLKYVNGISVYEISLKYSTDRKNMYRKISKIVEEIADATKMRTK